VKNKTVRIRERSLERLRDISTYTEESQVVVLERLIEREHRRVMKQKEAEKQERGAHAQKE